MHFLTIGLLIALALEQLVEYLHRRRQARHIEEKLRAEISENRMVAKFNIELTQQVISAIEAQLVRLEIIVGGDEQPKVSILPLPAWTGYPPLDAVWLMARDSALLLQLPNLLVQNCWRRASVCTAMDARKWMVEASRVQVEALLRLHGGPRVLSDLQCEALRIALSEYLETLRGYVGSVTLFARDNEMALANEAIPYMPLPVSGPDRQTDHLSVDRRRNAAA